MSTYHPLAGENVSTTAERMVALAKNTDTTVMARFNDVDLTANKHLTAEQIVANFHTMIAAAAEASRNSPEGKRSARESEEQEEKAQRGHDALMELLPNLDFTNQAAVLDWICEFQGPNDHIGVAKRQVDVLKIFAAHGYQPGVNTGETFNGEDNDNVARYIIGQALHGLRGEVGINPVVNKFTDDWKKKFAV